MPASRYNEISSIKSHKCEVGGAHLRNSVSHLFMNLKNNYLLKKLMKWANKKYLQSCTFFKR